MRKFFHGFCRAVGFFMRFPIVWKCCPKKMFLHLIFARVFSFKHFGWLQKTVLLIDLRPCFHFDDLLERCSIHLHLWIESKHRMNESNQWMEAMNRSMESNQRIESMNRITESRDKTRSCDYTHQVTTLICYFEFQTPLLLGFFAGIILTRWMRLFIS